MGITFGCSSHGEHLLTAVDNGDLARVEYLLAGGGRQGRAGAKGESSSKHLARYSSFLSRRSPLHCAAARGNAEVIDALLRHGADVDARNHTGQTALMIACHQGHREAVQTLLLHNADVQAVDINNGRSALHYAVSSGKVECARLLLCDHIPSVPLALGAPRLDGGHTFVIREEPKWSNAPERCLAALVDARADRGITPLHLAAMYGHHETLQLLLDVGARVNAMTRTDFMDGMYSQEDFLEHCGTHNSALHYAACNGSFLCCQALLAFGADRTKENGNGWTPHFIAKLWRHRPALEELLDPSTPLPLLPLFAPSRFLSLPLCSVMKAARELGLGYSHSGEEGPRPTQGETGAKPTTCYSPQGGVCPVCLDRRCTLVADGCNHELCTLCALNLCSVGGSSSGASLASTAPTRLLSTHLLPSPSSPSGQGRDTGISLAEAAASSVLSLETLDTPASTIPDFTPGQEAVVEPHSRDRLQQRSFGARFEEEGEGSSDLGVDSRRARRDESSSLLPSDVVQAAEGAAASSEQAGRASTSRRHRRSGSRASQDASTLPQHLGSPPESSYGQSTGTPNPVCTAPIGTLPCPLCRHSITCFFQLPGTSKGKALAAVEANAKGKKRAGSKKSAQHNAIHSRSTHKA